MKKVRRDGYITTVKENGENGDTGYPGTIKMIVTVKDVPEEFMTEAAVGILSAMATEMLSLTLI